MKSSLSRWEAGRGIFPTQRRPRNQPPARPRVGTSPMKMVVFTRNSEVNRTQHLFRGPTAAGYPIELLTITERSNRSAQRLPLLPELSLDEQAVVGPHPVLITGFRISCSRSSCGMVDCKACLFD